MNILITGARGFIGKNLLVALKNIRDGKDKTRRLSPIWSFGNMAEILVQNYWMSIARRRTLFSIWPGSIAQKSRLNLRTATARSFWSYWTSWNGMPTNVRSCFPPQFRRNWRRPTAEAKKLARTSCLPMPRKRRSGSGISFSQCIRQMVSPQLQQCHSHLLL